MIGSRTRLSLAQFLMICRWRRLPLVALGLLALTTSASAQGVWVLWVEAPGGSDQWTIARIPEPRFAARDDCERRAQDLNDVELTVAKMERWSGEARNVFSCLPDTVDPRPEAALLLDTVGPRGRKGK